MPAQPAGASRKQIFFVERMWYGLRYLLGEAFMNFDIFVGIDLKYVMVYIG